MWTGSSQFSWNWESKLFTVQFSAIKMNLYRAMESIRMWLSSEMVPHQLIIFKRSFLADLSTSVSLSPPKNADSSRLLNLHLQFDSRAINRIHQPFSRHFTPLYSTTHHHCPLIHLSMLSNPSPSHAKSANSRFGNSQLKINIITNQIGWKCLEKVIEMCVH